VIGSWESKSETGLHSQILRSYGSCSRPIFRSFSALFKMHEKTNSASELERTIKVSSRSKEHFQTNCNKIQKLRSLPSVIKQVVDATEGS
jgi:hypothetical protein